MASLPRCERPRSPIQDVHCHEPKKRIAVFFDGTWNEPGSNTHIWRIHTMVSHMHPDGTLQITYYDQGVGTDMLQYTLGGMFALGLSEKIQKAYSWLMRKYNKGDEVYVFGFSRGAFQARSFCGFIGCCGLLRPGSPMSVEQVYARYRRASKSKPGNTEQTLSDLNAESDESHKTKDWTLEEHLLHEYSRVIPIHFAGLFDTVAAIGLPFGNIPGVSSSAFQWHNVQLNSTMLRKGCHALALDEFRYHFRPTWLLNCADGQVENANIEQRWFCGAHSNVGGGYPEDPLALIPLNWIVGRAEEEGLHFRGKPATKRLYGDEYLYPITDSYKAFLRPVGPLVLSRHVREILPNHIVYSKTTNEKRNIQPSNITIDKSVFQKWQNKKLKPGEKLYRPKNLQDWVEKHLGKHISWLDEPDTAVDRSAATGEPLENNEARSNLKTKRKRTNSGGRSDDSVKQREYGADDEDGKATDTGMNDYE